MEKKKNLNDKNKIAVTTRKSDLILILMRAMWQLNFVETRMNFLK